MTREAIVYLRTERVGILREDDAGVQFTYDPEYANLRDAKAISFTLPVRDTPYLSKTMIPFFDGLIPEGWLLDIATHEWKLNPRDRMALLMTVCRNSLGAASVVGVEQNEVEDGE